MKSTKGEARMKKRSACTLRPTNRVMNPQRMAAGEQAAVLVLLWAGGADAFERRSQFCGREYTPYRESGKAWSDAGLQPHAEARLQERRVDGFPLRAIQVLLRGVIGQGPAPRAGAGDGGAQDRGDHFGGVEER